MQSWYNLTLEECMSHTLWIIVTAVIVVAAIGVAIRSFARRT